MELEVFLLCCFLLYTERSCCWIEFLEVDVIDWVEGNGPMSIFYYVVKTSSFGTVTMCVRLVFK